MIQRIVFRNILAGEFTHDLPMDESGGSNPPQPPREELEVILKEEQEMVMILSVTNEEMGKDFNGGVEGGSATKKQPKRQAQAW
jgi:hypothetical protein